MSTKSPIPPLAPLPDPDPDEIRRIILPDPDPDPWTIEIDPDELPRDLPRGEPA